MLNSGNNNRSRVTLISKYKIGGDCLNTGCVPSKVLIRSAKHLSHIKHSAEFGIKHATVEFDFAEVMERVQAVIKTVESHDSVERYTELGVDIVEGEAKIISPWEVRVKTLTSRSIIIAAGAKPLIPRIEQVDSLTSDNIWNIRELPKHLLVLGSGPIGCELAQSFARLGSQVIQVKRNLVLWLEKTLMCQKQ